MNARDLAIVDGCAEAMGKLVSEMEARIRRLERLAEVSKLFEASQPRSEASADALRFWS